MKRAYAECKVVNDGEGDIAATMDGIWMRRGHVTKFGGRSVIWVDNCKVLDTKVCCKFFHACPQHSKDDKKSTEYKEWYAKRKCVQSILKELVVVWKWQQLWK
jgi:Zn-finger nucleic acid-binding protein